MSRNKIEFSGGYFTSAQEYIYEVIPYVDTENNLKCWFSVNLCKGMLPTFKDGQFSENKPIKDMNINWSNKEEVTSLLQDLRNNCATTTHFADEWHMQRFNAGIWLGIVCHLKTNNMLTEEVQKNLYVIAKEYMKLSPFRLLRNCILLNDPKLFETYFKRMQEDNYGISQQDLYDLFDTTLRYENIGTGIERETPFSSNEYIYRSTTIYKKSNESIYKLILDKLTQQERKDLIHAQRAEYSNNHAIVQLGNYLSNSKEYKDLLYELYPEKWFKGSLISRRVRNILSYAPSVFPSLFEKYQKSFKKYFERKDYAALKKFIYNICESNSKIDDEMLKTLIDSIEKNFPGAMGKAFIDKECAFYRNNCGNNDVNNKLVPIIVKNPDVLASKEFNECNATLLVQKHYPEEKYDQLDTKQASALAQYWMRQYAKSNPEKEQADTAEKQLVHETAAQKNMRKNIDTLIKKLENTPITQCQDDLMRLSRELGDKGREMEFREKFIGPTTTQVREEIIGQRPEIITKLDRLITKLNGKKAEFRVNADKGKDESSKLHNWSSEIAVERLVYELTIAKNKYLTNPQAEDSEKTLKTECNAAIDGYKKILGEHRGWGKHFSWILDTGTSKVLTDFKEKVTGMKEKTESSWLKYFK